MIHRLSLPSQQVTLRIFNNKRTLKMKSSKKRKSLMILSKKSPRTVTITIIWVLSKAKKMHRQWLTETNRSLRSCLPSLISLTALDVSTRASLSLMMILIFTIKTLILQWVMDYNREEWSQVVALMKKKMWTDLRKFRKLNYSLRAWWADNSAIIKWRVLIGSTNYIKLN